MKHTEIRQRPNWLRRRVPADGNSADVERLLRKSQLHTVCEEAACPNRQECFAQGTATFLILGDHCSRNCRFCAVRHGPKSAPDADEPRNVAETAEKLGLAYVVVTSVTRDDLEDGGAGHFAETILAIRKKIPHVRIEVLIPDFQGSSQAIEKVVSAGPDVLNHNIETVPRLYERARPGADFGRSLSLLESVSFLDPAMPTKSGLMLGLGETDDEIRAAMTALRKAGCRLLTIGQYLQPSPRHLPVENYISPERFEAWRQEALTYGFTSVASGPFVRSSYQAAAMFEKQRQSTHRERDSFSGTGACGY